MGKGGWGMGGASGMGKGCGWGMGGATRFFCHQIASRLGREGSRGAIRQLYPIPFIHTIPYGVTTHNIKQLINQLVLESYSINYKSKMCLVIRCVIYIHVLR